MARVVIVERILTLLPVALLAAASAAAEYAYWWVAGTLTFCAVYSVAALYIRVRLLARARQREHEAQQRLYQQQMEQDRQAMEAGESKAGMP